MECLGTATALSLSGLYQRTPMHEPRRVVTRSTKRARRGPKRGIEDRTPRVRVWRRANGIRPDKVILIEDENGVQRMTAVEMFDSFERDAADFEALKVCVG